MTTAGDGAPRHETIFTMEATPIKFGPGASADTGWELKRLGAKRRHGGVRPRRDRGRDHGQGARADRGRGHRDRALRRRPHRADLRLVAGGRRFRGRRRLRRLRRHRRRLEHGHGQGRRPRRHPSRADHGLRQPADRRRPQAVVAAQAAGHGADHVGHGLGGDLGGRARHPRPARQVGHLAPLPPPTSGHRRPGSDEIAAQGSDRLDRPRRRLPRGRVVHLAALRHARPSRVARRPAALPGLQPDRGPVVGEGARARRPLPAPGGARTPTTSRRAGS